MNIELYNEDNLKIMKTLSDESIDVICIDPPYLYLKNQKLERVFDELKFFSECKRLLTKNGFIVMFGRGESFYRWNTLLADLGFVFKEEIVWDKSYVSSPVTPISRVHETIVIYSKENGSINPCRVPYIEQKEFNHDSLIADIKRIKSSLKNSNSFDAIINYIENNIVDFGKDKIMGNNTTVQGIIKDQDRGLKTYQSISNGLKEKSIIKSKREHYSSIHPTQKPVRLLERLLKLVIPMKNKKIVVADWFSGSNSCCEAVINLQSEYPEIEFEFIGTEIDLEYFTDGKKRIDNIMQPEPLKN